MKSLWHRICSAYLVIYCGLILPPTAVLALLEYWRLCDPDQAPWLRTAAMLGAIPLVIYGVFSGFRSEKKKSRHM